MPRVKLEILLLPILVLGLLFRLQHFSQVFRGDMVLFNGFDSYYHLRLAEIIVKSGKRIGFDSYLNYPYGLKISWLPLYHWILSFPGIILGFRATEIFAATLPVLMGLITVGVIYFIALETFQNRYVAVISAFLTSLTPKLVSIQSLGSSDYHGWNVAVFLLAILFFLKGVNGEERTNNYLNFLVSGFFLALLSASWLGGSIYTSIIVLLAIIAARYNSIDAKNTLFVFLPPAIVSYILPFTFNSVFQPLQLSLPYLAILVFVLVFLLANILAERKASVDIESELRRAEREMDSKRKRKKDRKSKRDRKELPVKNQDKFVENVVSRYKNIASILVIALGLTGIVILYLSPLQSVRLGINYILGISPYLPTIAEARSMQILLVAVESGIFTFLVAIPFSIYHIFRGEKNSKYLFAWLVSALVLSMLQVRFDGILVPVLAIYSAYGICYILHASNIPVLSPEANMDSKSARDKKKKGERGEEIWGKTEVAYSLIIILFVSSTGLFFSFISFDLSDDWLSSLLELKGISPQTSGYLNPVEKPEYSVLSWWDYGNWILYIAKRPVVCNNFQAGAIDAAKFFTTSNKTLAKEILEKRGVRYIITDDKMMLGNETFKGKFQAIMRIAGLDTRDPGFVLETYNSSMFYRLHIGNGVKGIKLLFRHGSVKVFEVEGSGD